MMHLVTKYSNLVTYHLTDIEKGRIMAFKELGWSTLQISQHHSSIAYFNKNQANLRKKKMLKWKEISKVFREIDKKMTSNPKLNLNWAIM